MLKEKVEKALVEQIEKEMYSSNLYLAMASWSERNGFKGVAEWMYAQAEEERVHMLKFMEYVNERGGSAIVPAIEQPPVEFEDVRDLFEKTYEHEQFITQSINDIVAVMLDEKDFNSQQWIQWFVTEQLEEEASVSDIMDKLKLIGNDSLYFFDRDIMSMRGTASSSTTTGA